MKRLLLFLSSLFITNSFLQAQNVGVGTNTPLQPLHISRTADTALLLLENKTSLDINTNVGMYFKNGNLYTGGVRTVGTGTSFARLSLYTYASGSVNALRERLSITDAGQVGIGSNNPLMQLHVSSNSSPNLLLMENPVSLGNGTGVNMFFKNGLYYTGAIKTTGADAQAARLGFFTLAGQDATQLKERMSIADDGKVGIGITAPGTSLHVSTAADSALLLLERQSAIATGSSTGMYFKNGNRYTGAIKTIGSGTTAARLSFYTYASTATTGLQERLTIRDDGNVGINSANPSAQLEVVGTAKFSQGTDDVAMEISGPIKMTGSSKPAFVLVCSASNLTDAFTPTINYVIARTYYNAVIIDNALCNYDPNAIVMVTPVGTPVAFAVVYDTNINKWKVTIDHHSVKEDGCWGSGSPSTNCGPYSKVFLDYLPIGLTAGQKFNVMIMKQ